MTLLEQGSPAEVAERRDQMLRLAEGRMEEAAGAAMRQFLRRLQAAVTPESLTAAAGDFPRSTQLFTLGEASDWWEDAVNEHVTAAVRSVWQTGYHDTRDGRVVASSLQAAEDHLASVVDRLSRTATPTIPEQAMNIARVALSAEMARGSSVATMSQRLASEFSWDADATFARGRLAELDGQVDRILDAIGPPGDPAREAARLQDPVVAQLQADRAEQVKQIDAVQSTWETRAERIARTETTGAYNAGALDAGYVEGAGVKVWLATADDRTRETHLDASGQCVPLDDQFDVGGALLQMPADPAAPPEESINCRCTIVFAASCAEADALYGGVDAVMDEERDRRGLAPDADRPTAIVTGDDDATPAGDA